MGYNVEALAKLEEWARHQYVNGGDELDMDGWIVVKEYEGTDLVETSMCLAGKAVLDDGWEPDMLSITFNDSVVQKVKKEGVGHRRIGDLAKEILGITDEESGVLFAVNFADKAWAKKAAVQFLWTLLRRAKAGQPNMTPHEVSNWYLGVVVQEYRVPLPYGGFTR